MPSRARPAARELAPRPAGFETEEAFAVAGGLGAAAAAELVVVFVDTPIGAALHALLALALVLQWVVGEPATYRRCLAALALVPLTRIVSMALVLPDLEPAAWGTIAAAFVLVSALLMARALEMGQAELRWQFPSRWELTAVLSAGAVLVALPASALLERLPATGAAVVFLILAAVTEEVTFRGVIQGTLRQLYGRAAILYANLPFVVLYLGTHSLAMILLAAMIGLVAGWSTERSRSIWPAIGVHAAFSLSAGLLWPAVLGI